MIHQVIRSSIEIIFWVLALSLVTALSSCDEQDKQPGAKQECILSSEGNICRTPEGISQK